MGLVSLGGLGARKATTQTADGDNDENTLWHLEEFPSKTTAALTLSASMTVSVRGQPTQKSTPHQEDN